MTDEIAQEAAQAPTSPEDAESSQATPTSEAVAAEPDSPPDLADSDSAKPRSQKRIEQLSGDNAALREYGEFWRQQALAQQPAPVAATPKPKPTMEQFDHDPDRFAQATVDWATEQATSAATKAVETQLDARTEADRKADLQSKWEERASEFAKDHDDYQQVVLNPVIKFTSEMVEAMAGSEKGPNIAYHLGMNPDKAARIAKMTPMQQAAAVGRLEAEVSKPAAKPQPSNAPQPPNPVSGQSPGQRLEDLPEIDDWMAQRREERREKGLR